MKKQFVALIAMGGFGVAHAQSSVTLYGTLDAGLTYVTNESGHQNYKTDNGILHGNRWGLKGKEDLGGGYATVFVLEGGYNLGTGKANQSGAEFGRQAYVGIQGPFGSLRAGDQYDIISDYPCNDNVSFYASGYGIHQGDFDRMSCTRLPNAIKYTTPTFGGFQGAAMYSFSNVAGSFHDGSTFEVGGKYNHGPFDFEIAYASLAKPTYDPYNRMGTRMFLGQTVASVSGNVEADLATSLTIDSTHILDVGGSYALGNWTFMADFTDTSMKYKSITSVMHVYEGGVEYQFTPALKGVGGYQHTTFEGHTWNEGSAGLQYSLSKATLVYVSGDFLHASAGVDPVIGWGFTPSLSNHQADVRIGMFHTF